MHDLEITGLFEATISRNLVSDGASLQGYYLWLERPGMRSRRTVDQAALELEVEEMWGGGRTDLRWTVRSPMFQSQTQVFWVDGLIGVVPIRDRGFDGLVIREAKARS